MNNVSRKDVHWMPESTTNPWKVPALMALSFAFSESVLCIMSALFRKDWLLVTVSICGPLAMIVGVYSTLNIPISSDENSPAVKGSVQSYHFLFILSCVYVVTYGFYYGVAQILLRQDAGLR